MTNGKAIATRESLGYALVELAERHDDIVVLDADLCGATRTSRFQKAYPERFIQCGIAEANMLGVAAGLSTMGFVPFASSFAMFATGRAYDQIRNSVAYPRLNVKIAATHGGLTVGEDGATHQCCEDYALMKVIPEMIVMSPADDVEARQMVEAAYHYDGPVYMRFSRAYSPVFHDQNYRFKIGTADVVTEGTDIGIVANGTMVWEAIAAARLLSAQGISARVINMPTIKPVDRRALLETADRCRRIITAEEHSILGGLGETVCRVLAEDKPTPVKCIGVNDRFGHSGPAVGLMKEFGLCSERIFSEAMRLYGAEV